MYSTSELDELFQILNLIEKDLNFKEPEPHWSNTTTVLLQQELQNPYWCLHDPIATKSYQISCEMDIETMPHAMYFSGNKETIAKISQVPYQVIDYDDKGIFQAKLMDNTQVEIFIDNGATPSILPLNIYIIFTQYCRNTQKWKATLLFTQEEA